MDTNLRGLVHALANPRQGIGRITVVPVSAGALALAFLSMGCADGAVVTTQPAAVDAGTAIDGGRTIADAGQESEGDASTVAIDGGQPPPVDAGLPFPFGRVLFGSKLGVHGIYSTGPDGNGPLDVVPAAADRGTHFSVVKSVDDLWWLGEVRRISPTTITVARLTQPTDGVQDVGGFSDAEITAYGDRIMDTIRDRLEREPALRDATDYWEVVNEPDPPSVEGYAKLARVMIRCIERANEMGIRIAIFSLNAGTPEWNEMQAMVETGVFARAKAGGHAMAVHEGVLGVDVAIDDGFGGSIPGAPAVEGAGAMCFRYRYLYSLLQDRDEVVPLIVSEFYAGGGYEDQGGTPSDIRARMAWYDERFSQDYYTLGFLPFTIGPSPGWHGADYGFAYAELIEHMVSARDRENARP